MKPSVYDLGVGHRWINTTDHYPDAPREWRYDRPLIEFAKKYGRVCFIRLGFYVVVDEKGCVVMAVTDREYDTKEVNEIILQHCLDSFKP